MIVVARNTAKKLARTSIQITRYSKETDYSNHTSVQEVEVTFDQMVSDLPYISRLWFAERVSTTLLRISYTGTWFDIVLKEEEVSC